MFQWSNRIWCKGLVWKSSIVPSNQVIQWTRWYSKRILIKNYSVPREFSWTENYKPYVYCLKYNDTTTVFTSFLLLSFQAWKRALVKFEKKIFVSLQKLFSFSKKSRFRILAIQILWRHQMSNHKARNPFYWTTSEVNTVYNEIWPVYLIL